MTSSLADPYQFDGNHKVWSRHGYDSISYNDGNEIEQRLLSIVENAGDCSVLSTELRSHCTDWPSLYHLSSSRANILRPFESKLKGKILEIGAGCGAITRYLGECGAEVLALEGTLRRASIARQRTRDLDNVTILAEDFSNFETNEKYDVITLIGVLEYASMFVQGANPHLAMLKRARELLNPQGLLIIAIENQLGLKYFAGAPEDHVGEVSYGIEDRYEAHGIRTFGRQALEALLKKSGFEKIYLLACFPDYKFPVSIISERGFKSKEFDSGSLAAQSVRRDPQLPHTLAFRPERVWPCLVDNELALDLGNSFLVCASTEHDGSGGLDSSLAWHFSTERRASFCKITKFTKNAAGDIEAAITRPKESDAADSSHQNLTNSISHSNTYIHGPSLSSELLDLITRDGWSADDVRSFLFKYLNTLSTTANIDFSISSFFDEIISGKYIDAIPQNFIQSRAGNYELIDTEWEWNRSISFAYLLFRALHSLTLSITKLGNHPTGNIQTHADFLCACFSYVGCEITADHLARFCSIEQELQQLVCPRKIDDNHIFEILTTQKTNEPNAWEKINFQLQRIQSLESAAKFNEITTKTIQAQLDGKEEAIEKSNSLLHERFVLIKQLESTVRERDNFIAHTLNSRSWRITKPLRFFNRQTAKLRQTNLQEAKNWIFIKLLRLARRVRNRNKRPATLFICIHAYYPEVLPVIFEKVKTFKSPIKIVITTVSEKQKEVRAHIQNFGLDAEIMPVENKGRDILPFLKALTKSGPRDLILKLHTKKSPHRSDGDAWRNDMLTKLLNPMLADSLLEVFRKNPELGMVIPEGHAISIDKYMGQNQGWFHRLKSKMPASKLAMDDHIFPGGAMFYARADALNPLLSLGLNQGEFETEAQQLDGTLAHAIERLFGASVTTAGYYIATSANPSVAAEESRSEFHPL